jgi:hypothetical protein
MIKTAERNLKVDYYEKEEDKNIWVVESHMSEEEHDITVTLEIDMEQLVIGNAKIIFNRYPQAECKLIEKKAKQLVGMNVDTMFSQNVMKIFMGPEGCPNIMTLLNIAVPGIIYYYYPYKIKSGEITREQFYEILREKEKNACLAHSTMFAD